jgi:hypothetical protein
LSACTQWKLAQELFMYINCSFISRSTGHHDVMTNGMKYTWAFKTTLRIPLFIQPYNCCSITMGFTENTRISASSQNVQLPIWRRLTKQLQYWTTST